MKYDITKQTAPAMPYLGKGTECIKLLISQASKDMREPLVPMLFPPLGAHVSGAEFLYPDQTWKETCGMMANLVGDSGGNKGQLSLLVEAICRDFRQHDKGVTDKPVEWKKGNKTEPNCKKNFYLSDLTPPVNSLAPPPDSLLKAASKRKQCQTRQSKR